MSAELQELSDRIGAIVRERNWNKSWAGGGCYIHLEVSEFIESLRGKGDTPPEKEAGDVLISLFAVLDYYNISIADVLISAQEAVSRLEVDKTYGRVGSQ